MLGGKVREETYFLCNRTASGSCKEMGFVGGKIPLVYGQDDGMEGLKKSIELAADMREKCGDEFLLMWDCWMALDLYYAKRLMQASADLKFNWIEGVLQSG